MRLCEGFREERRVAVLRPIPEEPPVMRIVFGVEMRVERDEAVGVKRDIFGVGSFEVLVKTDGGDGETEMVEIGKVDVEEEKECIASSRLVTMYGCKR